MFSKSMSPIDSPSSITFSSPLIMTIISPSSISTSTSISRSTDCGGVVSVALFVFPQPTRMIVEAIARVVNMCFITVSFFLGVSEE